MIEDGRMGASLTINENSLLTFGRKTVIMVCENEISSEVENEPRFI